MYFFSRQPLMSEAIVPDIRRQRDAIAFDTHHDINETRCNQIKRKLSFFTCTLFFFFFFSYKTYFNKIKNQQYMVKKNFFFCLIREAYFVLSL